MVFVTLHKVRVPAELFIAIIPGIIIIITTTIILVLI